MAQGGLRTLLLLVLTASIAKCAPHPSSGTFVLHKFGRAIGTETYSTVETDGLRTLTSKFLFTDRGTKVPLEATFVSRGDDLAPISYKAKGRSSRFSEMDDVVTVRANQIVVVRSGKTETLTPNGPWFMTDGYSPAAMQEQMLGWWLSSGRPQEFTVYPANAKVRIGRADPVVVDGKTTLGYTVDGLIWGEEALWMDESGALEALVSTDAEFDHFEAIREPYEKNLDIFIGAAVKANLSALRRLTTEATSATAPQVAIVGATLEDSTGAPAVKDSTILIEGGVIRQVGKRSQVQIPKGAMVVDATGRYAVPGLWDMHAHYEQVEWGPIYLASGVTSVRDVGNEFAFIRTLHQELDRRTGAAIGPHLEFAGIIDGSGPSTLGAVVADTPEQAGEWITKYKAIGAKQIKVYDSIKSEILKAIAEQAHAQGMSVTGHVPEGMTAEEAVKDGMDQINHLGYLAPYFAHWPNGADGKPDYTKDPQADLDSDRSKQLIDLLRQHHTVIDPTFAVVEMNLHAGQLDRLEPGVDHLPPQLKSALDSPPDPRSLVGLYRKIALGILRRLHAAGIPVIAGTDQAIPGYSLHRELELYVEAGFTPLEAMQSATIQAARALGVESESGTLEVGKRGDVLLLDADPLQDIHNSLRVWRTVASGTVYEPSPLWRAVGFVP